MTGFLRRLQPERDEVVDAVFVLATVGLALWSFKSSFGGVEFFIIGMIGVLFGVVVSHVSDRMRWPAVVSAAIWAAVYVLIGGVLANRSQAPLGFLPSLETISAAIRGVVRGWKELLTTVPPVGRTGDLLALPVFSGIVAGGASLILARRRRWTVMPALPAVVVLALGILCGTLEPVSPLLHGGAMALLMIGWAALRHGRERPSLDSGLNRARRLAAGGLLLGVSAFLGLTFSDALPLTQARERTVWRDTFDPPPDLSTFPSPLGYYRHFVKELEDDVLFEVTGLPEGTPIRMATLDDYDGIVWKVTGGTRALRRSGGYFERVGTDVAPDFDRPEATVTVSFPSGNRYSEIWLPTVGEVRSIEFGGGARRSRVLAENFRYNRTTDTAALLGKTSPGDRYEMTVAVPALFEDLDSSAEFDGTAAKPIDGVPGQVLGLGSGLVEEADGVERIQILKDFLETGYYSDSGEDQAAVPAGHGSNRLLRFADSSELIGNAEQYAATLGLILRNSAIPSRVVVGFVPRDTPDATGTVSVTGFDAEVWVEVLVERVGWVAVFSTPDRTKTTIVPDNSPKPIPDRETQVPPPPPVVEPETESDPAGESEQVERNDEDEEEDEEEDEPVTGSRNWLAVVGLSIAIVPIVIAMIALGTIVALKRRRSRKRWKVHMDTDRVSNGWSDLIDHAVDTGVAIPKSSTRREAADLLGTDEARVLARRADATTYGPFAADSAIAASYWADVRRERKALTANLGLFERFNAAVNLESFRRRSDQRRWEEARARSVAANEAKNDTELVEA